MSSKTKRNYCKGCRKDTIWDFFDTRGGWKKWKCKECGLIEEEALS